MSEIKFAHKLFVCPPTCDGCHFCRGGLAYCSVCQGGEGDLPRHCKGTPLTALERREVYAGKLDFVNGEWWTPEHDEWDVRMAVPDELMEVDPIEPVSTARPELETARRLLNEVLDWRNDEANNGFPHQLREEITAHLLAGKISDQIYAKMQAEEEWSCPFGTEHPPGSKDCLCKGPA